MNFPVFFAALALLSAASFTELMAAPRSVPQPLAGHPGNVFLAGEPVVIEVPPTQTAGWKLFDYDNKAIAEPRVENGKVNAGVLPIGFYRLRCDGQSNWISCAVIEPLHVPTPAASPIDIDVAMGGFFPKDKMPAVANLCALAGINWVRDRFIWREVEPERGKLAEHTRYDDSALAQSSAGLNVLQVNHSSPKWANENGKRFPIDLRDTWRLHRDMARRWTGQVMAFEPWNEADIDGFGGHTGAEMASLQKAAYLGLKAGRPDVIACLNVFAAHNRRQLEDLHDNRAWPYFDSYNLHHYEPFDNYPKLYADHRAVSAGHPMWVSECAVPVKWSGDEKLKEPSDADLRVQSERIARVYACSVHEGAVHTFYFILSHYVEGQTQFGLIRKDLTPRPAYVALAAAGRLLAGAKPLGSIESTNKTLRAYLFRAAPDGESRNLLVAWTTSGRASLDLPSEPVATFDHLGRKQPAAKQLTLTTAPLFAVFPAKSERQFKLQPPPAPPKRLAGRPSPIVFQALWPKEKVLLNQSAYELSSEQEQTVPVFAYNFSDAQVSGTLRVETPKGWRASLPGKIVLPAGCRVEIPLKLSAQGGGKLWEAVRMRGDFGRAGEAVLSIRVTPGMDSIARKTGTALPGANQASGWGKMISGNGKMTISNTDGGILVEAEPRGTDRWLYPRLKLPAEGRPTAGVVGLACTITLLEGDVRFRTIFDEETGSSYSAEFVKQPACGKTVETLVLFENASSGAGWSKPDPNGVLDPDQIQSVKIGCNTKGERVKFVVSNVRWIKL